METTENTEVFTEDAKERSGGDGQRRAIFRAMRHLLLPLFIGIAVSASAQTTYLPLGSEDYPLLDRLETKSGRLSSEIFTTLKPVPRKGMVRFLEDMGDIVYDTTTERTLLLRYPILTPIDKYNVQHAISTSGEWAGNVDGAIPSKRPILKHFYRYQPDLYRVNNENFFLSVNPVLAARLTYQSNSPESPALPGDADDNVLFLNSRGAEVRGRIKDRIGFYTFFTDNQETPPAFVRNYVEARQAVPGADYYQEPKPGKYDYLLARGYVDVAAVKDHVNVTFGYDKHFIGDGVRSLFLSDFASSGATFLRLNTRIWRLNYQNLFMELTPQYQRGGDRVLPHKYATVHHLSVNATRWLNVGLFEAVCFSRPDHFEFSYLNPIILYRHIERLNGSPDNAMLGLNFKAIALRRIQFYGQALLDEFRFSELRAGRGWYGNKFGLQGGFKVFDAFGIRNLDAQMEVNVVRPFTYTHYDTLANWTHYNQPLAHPLGAGFREAIVHFRYQPVRNLFLSARGIYYTQGGNPGGQNWGTDIFRSYTAGRPDDYGFSLVNDFGRRVLINSFTAAYELRENLFLDAGVTLRESNPFTSAEFRTTSTYFYGGFRLNMARRGYDFY